VFVKLRKYLLTSAIPPDDTVTAEVQERLQEQDSSVYRQGLENLMVHREKYFNL
jgi:hypothetical protein